MYYCSNHEPLFQSDPLEYRQSSFKPKGWTDTVAAYLNEAKKEATLLLRNRQLQGHRYRWDVGINFESRANAKANQRYMGEGSAEVECSGRGRLPHP